MRDLTHLMTLIDHSIAGNAKVFAEYVNDWYQFRWHSSLSREQKSKMSENQLDDLLIDLLNLKDCMLARRKYLFGGPNAN